MSQKIPKKLPHSFFTSLSDYHLMVPTCLDPHYMKPANIIYKN